MNVYSEFLCYHTLREGMGFFVKQEETGDPDMRDNLDAQSAALILEQYFLEKNWIS